jgi:hypothetical protein
MHIDQPPQTTRIAVAHVYCSAVVREVRNSRVVLEAGRHPDVALAPRPGGTRYGGRRGG